MRLVDKRDYPPFFGHPGGVPRRFINNPPPAAHAPRDADAAACLQDCDGDTASATPNWFADFVMDRATRKPSAHDEGLRQDFAAVAALLTAGSPADIALADITKNTMRPRSPPTPQPMNRPLSGAAGQPGMCCATSSIPTNSSAPIRCRSSGGPRRPRPCPLPAPARGRRSARGG